MAHFIKTASIKFLEAIDRTLDTSLKVRPGSTKSPTKTIWDKGDIEGLPKVWHRMASRICPSLIFHFLSAIAAPAWGCQRAGSFFSALSSRKELLLIQSSISSLDNSLAQSCNHPASSAFSAGKWY